MTVKEVVDEIEKLCKDNKIIFYGIAGRVEPNGKLDLFSLVTPDKVIIETLGSVLVSHTQNILNKLED